jgi:hypothetical protein
MFTLLHPKAGLVPRNSTAGVLLQHLRICGGMDYHVTPNTTFGFALAGGGT